MTRRPWGRLQLRVREVAVHEAAHAVIGEVLGWPVMYLTMDRIGGECVLGGEPPAPWVDVVVSAAGHAAETWYFGGEPSEYGAERDRRDGAKALERAGVDTADSPFAVVEVEGWLWPVFADDGVAGAVMRVAKALVRAKRHHLGRAEFLRAADLGLIDRRAVRRYCRRLAFDVHLQHLGEGTT